jgi:hypothetical protein
MPKRQSDFSPSVNLFLTNLPTIRQIQRLLDENTIKTAVKAFLKHLEDRLPDELPAISTWQSKITGESLFLFPNQGWRVVKDDHIKVCVSMDTCIEPGFYNEMDDPMVGLYVPSKWKHIQSFTNGLKRFRIPDFEHISEHKDIHEELDESYPFWSTVPLATLIMQKTLDVDGLERAMIDRARRLVAKEEKISKLISTLRRR